MERKKIRLIDKDEMIKKLKNLMSEYIDEQYKHEWGSIEGVRANGKAAGMIMAIHMIEEEEEIVDDQE